MEFKQTRNSQMHEFSDESMVYFSHCDRNKKMSLNEVLKITSDIAVEDFRQQGLSTDFLLENKIAILVSRLSLRFHRMPRENEKITLTTTEEKSQALQFIRSYEITGEDGEKLVSGLSSWLLVNTETRRLMPIKYFTLKELSQIEKEHDCLPADKITVPENMEKIDERTIRFSDLDSNGHTNNARYAAFIMDALPPEYQDKVWKDFRINFSQEAILGDKLEIWWKKDDEAKKISILGKTEKASSFEAELYFS